MGWLTEYAPFSYMCGIFCSISKTGESFLEEVRHACRLVDHRGPDNMGCYHYANVYMAHRRLSIIDLSDRGSQPMSRNGSTIIFNGALYNYKEIRKELRELGYEFSSDSDTEVILQAYHRWGFDCLNKFNGMWSFVLLDERNDLIWASRDRFGIKPLYYFENSSGLHLVSEIKQFRALKSWSPVENKMIRDDFLKYGLIDHTQESFFEGVHKLKPGHNLTYYLQDKVLDISPYYLLVDKIGSFSGTIDDAKEELNNRLERSIELRLRADVDIGSCLSGGIDSSILVSKMSHNNAMPLKTFSMCHPGHSSINEEPYVNSLIDQLHIPNRKIVPTIEDVERLYEKVTWHMDEPLVSPSLITQYLLFKRAKYEGIKVMIDGQGADEILCGYDQFYSAMICHSFWQVGSIAMHVLRHNFGGITAGIRAMAIKRRKEIHRPSGNVGLYGNADPLQIKTLDLMNNMGLQALLHFEDRNSMAHGIEARCPYLDHHVVEFCLSLSPTFKIYRGVRKYILREVGKALLPRSIYRRYRKLGFDAPLKEWLYSLSPIVDEIPMDIKQFEALKNSNQIQKAWRLYGYSVWRKIFLK